MMGKQEQQPTKRQNPESLSSLGNSGAGGAGKRVPGRVNCPANETKPCRPATNDYLSDDGDQVRVGDCEYCGEVVTTAKQSHTLLRRMLTKVGHAVENGETYPVFVDVAGDYFTWDPDLGGGKLCKCRFEGRWSR